MEYIENSGLSLKKTVPGAKNLASHLLKDENEKIELHDPRGFALNIPKLRQGSYFPTFLEPRRTAEKALMAAIQEACIHGVSIRAVDDLVRTMPCPAGDYLQSPRGSDGHLQEPGLAALRGDRRARAGIPEPPAGRVDAHEFGHPPERVNKEIERRTNVAGFAGKTAPHAVFLSCSRPKREAATRLVGALMLEQNDEWAVSRRYMPVEKLTAVCNDLGAAPMIAAQ